MSFLPGNLTPALLRSLLFSRSWHGHISFGRSFCFQGAGLDFSSACVIILEEILPLGHSKVIFAKIAEDHLETEMFGNNFCYDFAGKERDKA